ncbi:hypothetical protein [Micromonospora sp. WMMD1274]|uniref:hypothetical protein n=1 Tax=Micromonospora sp. WMMD1274 TaxID=3404116 RepID=UPI001ADDE051
MANRVDGLIRELLIEAILLWEQEGFSRYSDGEVPCTVRIFDCACRVIEGDSLKWALIHVQYDGPQPNRAMRAGLEDPSKASRPDLNVRIGSALVHVEAKRLHLRDSLPKKYVQEGMRRFIDGRYSSDGHGLGAMLGYVLRDAPPDAITAVNAVIAEEADLGPSHSLQIPTQWSPRIHLTASRHHDRLRLLHHTIDLRAVAVSDH